tara:strand:+ start:2896 stop:4278 length:1383 start_codon:yes stop_codon:yes gene_type:complete
MTSTIKVNTIQNTCGADIIKESGNTITIGASGDTVTLGSGASQTGFGATGGISWQTSIKTANFTAANGEGYFVNTTGGAITVTLPSSPSAGNVVAIKDYARTFGTNKVTIARNGSNMDGVAENTDLQTDGLSVTFVFMDSTKGWSLINDDTTGQIGASFLVATGGTITTCGNFKIHTFTGPGTFCVSCAGNAAGSNTVDYLVVAGGGGGGADAGGGGGAGGFRLANATCMAADKTSPLATPTALPISATGFPITVGGGGAGYPAGATANKGSDGNPAVFSTITSTGGGGGGASPVAAGPGGSGGGGRGSNPTGGTGNTPPVSPPQGNPGGNGPAGGAGGGGAAAAGSPAGPSSPTPGGAGGAGSFVVQAGFAGCNGTPGPVSGAKYFSGGGGGSGDQSGVDGGTAGVGGGGVGRTRPSGSPGGNGTANTGGGGGGGAVPAPGSSGGAGGSGIVIIRYKFQ